MTPRREFAETRVPATVGRTQPVGNWRLGRMMRNPWLEIPLADYEAHMALPTIGQSRLIADQLDAVVARLSPRSIAIIGCAGGNGLDGLAGANVDRVVGVDIHPGYVDEARRRYEGRIPGLELYVADIQDAPSLFEPVDLLYVALVLEYVDVDRAMNVLWQHCKPDGVLAVVSQLPHEKIAEVSPSPYASLAKLAPVMHLVAPEELRLRAQRAGFHPSQSDILFSPAGKRFSLDIFRRGDGPRRIAEL